MSKDHTTKKYAKTITALAGSFDNDHPPEALKMRVRESIERLNTVKALLELHVFAPGLVMGVDPEDIVDDMENEDEQDDDVDIQNY